MIEYRICRCEVWIEAISEAIFHEYETKKNLSMKVIAGSKTKEFVKHRK